MSTDYATGSQLVKIRLVGGSSVDVPMLSPAGLAEVADKLHERRKKQAIANTRSVEFGEKEKKFLLKVLNAMDATPVRWGDIISPIAQDVWLQTTVVDIGMRGRDGVPDLIHMPEAAAELIGCTLTDQSETSGIDPFDVALSDSSPSETSIETPDVSAPSTDATATQ